MIEPVSRVHRVAPVSRKPREDSRRTYKIVYADKSRDPKLFSASCDEDAIAQLARMLSEPESTLRSVPTLSAWGIECLKRVEGDREIQVLPGRLH
jgi:hypothetical protein